LSPAACILGGIPDTSGTSTFTVTAADAAGHSASQLYELTVKCPDIVITPATLPPAIVGVKYYAEIMTSAGELYVEPASLPPGLKPTALQNGNLRISGTPEGAGNPFVVTATILGVCPVTKVYEIVVACPAITFVPDELPPATLDQRYIATITATLATKYSVGPGLPPELTPPDTSAAGIPIAGTPLTLGTYCFTATAIHEPSLCSGSKNYCLKVTCPAISLPARLPDGVVGLPYGESIVAGGSKRLPYTYIEIAPPALPPGLTLMRDGPLAGFVGGMPTAAGDYSVPVKATDAVGCSGEGTVMVHIDAAPPVGGGAVPALSKWGMFLLIAALAAAAMRRFSA
jgi:hypothetical protein